MDINDYGYSVLIQYDKRDKIFVARIPELDGCMAHGATREQAIQEINIALELWLNAAKDVNADVPAPMPYAS